MVWNKKIHNFQQILPAILDVILGTQNFSYPVMESFFDVGIFSLKMEIMENKEEPGESICWRARGEEEEMAKFLKWCAK